VFQWRNFKLRAPRKPMFEGSLPYLGPVAAGGFLAPGGIDRFGTPPLSPPPLKSRVFRSRPLKPKYSTFYFFTGVDSCLSCPYFLWKYSEIHSFDSCAAKKCFQHHFLARQLKSFYPPLISHLDCLHKLMLLLTRSFISLHADLFLLRCSLA